MPEREMMKLRIFPPETVYGQNVSLDPSLIGRIERVVVGVIGHDRPMGVPPAGCRMEWLVWGDDA